MLMFDFGGEGVAWNGMGCLLTCLIIVKIRGWVRGDRVGIRIVEGGFNGRGLSVTYLPCNPTRSILVFRTPSGGISPVIRSIDRLMTVCNVCSFPKKW